MSTSRYGVHILLLTCPDSVVDALPGLAPEATPTGVGAGGPLRPLSKDRATILERKKHDTVNLRFSKRPLIVKNLNLVKNCLLSKVFYAHSILDLQFCKEPRFSELSPPPKKNHSIPSHLSAGSLLLQRLEAGVVVPVVPGPGALPAPRLGPPAAGDAAGAPGTPGTENWREIKVAKVPRRVCQQLSLKRVCIVMSFATRSTTLSVQAIMQYW